MMFRLVLAGLFVCATPGCVNRAAAPERSDLLVIATTVEPPSLNPLYLQGRDAADVGALGYSGLTTYDRRGAIVADVATVVPTMANGGISRDGKRIVFHLRRGVRWQDGYPLTARDVVFSYRANTNPSNATPSQSFDTGIARVWPPIRTQSSRSSPGRRPPS